MKQTVSRKWAVQPNIISHGKSWSLFASVSCGMRFSVVSVEMLMFCGPLWLVLTISQQIIKGNGDIGSCITFEITGIANGHAKQKMRHKVVDYSSPFHSILFRLEWFSRHLNNENWFATPTNLFSRASLSSEDSNGAHYVLVWKLYNPIIGLWSLHTNT